MFPYATLTAQQQHAMLLQQQQQQQQRVSQQNTQPSTSQAQAAANEALPGYVQPQALGQQDLHHHQIYLVQQQHLQQQAHQQQLLQLQQQQQQQQPSLKPLHKHPQNVLHRHRLATPYERPVVHTTSSSSSSSTQPVSPSSSSVPYIARQQQLLQHQQQQQQQQQSQLFLQQQLQMAQQQAALVAAPNISFQPVNATWEGNVLSSVAPVASFASTAPTTLHASVPVQPGQPSVVPAAVPSVPVTVAVMQPLPAGTTTGPPLAAKSVPLTVITTQLPPTNAVNLSPNSWQNLVATRALPVRQALYSHVLESRDRPPASKEEAQALLEDMFKKRAEKVRIAMEEGSLCTTEALQSKLYRRRGSLAAHDTAAQPHARDDPPTITNERNDNSSTTTASPSASLQSSGQQNRSASPSTVHSEQAIRTTGAISEAAASPPLQDSPSPAILATTMLPSATLAIAKETVEKPAITPSADSNGGLTPFETSTLLFGDQSTLWGLSDDDLMASLSNFTAKLGDSMMAKEDIRPAVATSTAQAAVQALLKNDPTSATAPVLSPTSGHSPTTTNSSDFSSPQMPADLIGQDNNAFTAPLINPSAQLVVANTTGVAGELQDPLSIWQQNMQYLLSKGATQSSQMVSSMQQNVINQMSAVEEASIPSSAVAALAAITSVETASSTTSATGITPLLSSGPLTPIDPRWQAAMMTAMMDSQPTSSSISSLTNFLATPFLFPQSLGSPTTEIFGSSSGLNVAATGDSVSDALQDKNSSECNTAS